MKTLLIILASLFIFWLVSLFFAKSIIEGLSEGIEKRIEEESYVLKDFNFKDGAKYQLYIRNKSKGDRLITDVEILEDARDKVQLKLSWMNFAPGEGGNDEGLALYRDGELVFSKIGRAWSIYELAGLLEKSSLESDMIVNHKEPKENNATTNLERDKINHVEYK